MTAPDHADLRRLLAAGTPGPWEHDGEGQVWCPHHLISHPTMVADANLIAAAVNALPALLDEREALIRERDEARAMLREATESEFNEPCRFDHHGYCQGHGYDAPCLIPRARDVPIADGADQ